jgi:hypothetical protein
MSPGHVYCLAMDAHPGIVKIGATARDPAERLREANACTWSPWPFRVVATAAAADAWHTERTLHALLAARRINDRREFFVLAPDEARAIFAVLTPAPAAPAAPAGPAGPAADSVPSATAPCAFDAAGAQGKLRAWVEEHYTRIPLREKDTGTKLSTLYEAYTTAVPPVHARALGKTTFGRMLNTIYPNIGPHKNSASTVFLYLLR